MATTHPAALIEHGNGFAFYQMAVDGIENKNLDGSYEPPGALRLLVDTEPALELLTTCGDRACKVVAVSLDKYGRAAPCLTGVLSSENFFLAAQILEPADTVDEAIVQMNEWQFALSKQAEAHRHGN